MIAFLRPDRLRRGLVLSCGLSSIVVVAVLALYRPLAFVRLDNAVYDVMLRSGQIRPPGDDILIVDVDEHSLSTFGQWPWPRDLMGRLIDSLRKMGATVIAMDVIFAEPDRSPRGSAGRDPDAALADALRGGDVVLGYGMTFATRARSGGACALHPIGLAIVQSSNDTADPPFFEATGTLCSLRTLGAAAGASGFLNAAPDADGILRRAPLLIQYEGQVYPSLALASVIAATARREAALTVTNANAASLRLGDSLVPLDGRSNLLLRYRGRKYTFPYASAADILNGRADDAAVRGKIVFVGTNALGTREVVATPLDTLFAGVEVQATIADNLLQQDFLYRSASGPVIEAVLALLALLPALLLLFKRLAVALLGASLYVAALWFGSIWYVAAGGAIISPLYPTLAVFLSLATMTAVTLALERRRADAAGRDRTTAQRLMVQSLLSLTETRDRETGRHSQRTQQYTRLLAGRLSQNPSFAAYLTPARVELLASLAPLHDIGKVGIPDHILNKPGALSAEEYAEMRNHPTLGRDVILTAERQVGVRDDETLTMAKDIVYTHHERWDGSGYPQGLRGTAIPVEGRVLAVVDVYDAVVSRRLYQNPMTHEEAVGFIRGMRGTHFDPDVVDAFLSVAAEFKRLSTAASAA